MEVFNALINDLYFSGAIETIRLNELSNLG
jgi:hypothetical protein